MSVYVIALGGTGAKVVEAIVHEVAAGLFVQGTETSPDDFEDLKILFVDPDKGNGILARAINTINHYNDLQKTIKGGIDEKCPWWMQTKIEYKGLFSPFDVKESNKTAKENKTLNGFFELGEYSESDNQKYLFDILYTQREQNEPLDKGFKGRPAIGSAIWSGLTRKNNNQQKSWEEFINEIENESRQSRQTVTKVFLLGSIFGGTGASGFPTLGRLISKKLGTNIKLGGLLMLPYFEFQDQISEKEIYAKSQDFILKTEAALRYYGMNKLNLDPIYLLGTPSLKNVKEFSSGGSEQHNHPHFIELFGALALRDFIFNYEQKGIVRINRNIHNAIVWKDLPEPNQKDIETKIKNATRFAFAWLSTIVPDLNYAKKSPNSVNWARKFFSKEKLKLGLPEEKEKMETISNWCKDYLRWLSHLHDSGTRLDWFDTSNFGSTRNEKEELEFFEEFDRDKFTTLIKGTEGKKINMLLKPKQINPDNIEIENEGIVGLAKSIYRSILNN